MRISINWRKKKSASDNVSLKRSESPTYPTHAFLFVTVVDEMDKCKRQLGELEEKYAELNEPLEYSDSKQKHLFEKYMGLQFKLTEDKAISLVFTNVNAKDPEQRFVITLDVDEHEQWKGMCHTLNTHYTTLL